MAASSTQTRIGQVGRVMVPVEDQDRAIDFYVDKLGFEKTADIPFGNGDRWVEVKPAGGTASIALVVPPEGRGERAPIDTRIALDTDDIDATYEALKDSGVDVDDEVSRMGGNVPPLCWFRDSEGNTLMLVQPDQQ
jgi:catechol 2,3-dioxygenase-like lactoylglutathione lyase family enzyme